MEFFGKDIRKIADFGDALEVFNFLFLIDHLGWEFMALLSGKLLSFDAGNDAKIGTKLIAINHESLVRGEIETDGFFITKDISMIGTQPIHANDGIKALYGYWHEIDRKRMVVQGKGTTYAHIASAILLSVSHLNGKYFG